MRMTMKGKTMQAPRMARAPREGGPRVSSMVEGGGTWKVAAFDARAVGTEVAEKQSHGPRGDVRRGGGQKDHLTRIESSAGTRTGEGDVCLGMTGESERAGGRRLDVSRPTPRPDRAQATARCEGGSR